MALVAQAAYYFNYVIAILIESEKSRIQRCPQKPFNFFAMGMEFLYTVAIQVILLFILVGVLFMIIEMCFGSYNIMNVFFIIMEFLLRIIYPVRLEEQERRVFDDDDYTRAEITVA